MRKINGFLFGVLMVSLLAWAMEASATKPKPPPDQSQDQSQNQSQHQGQIQGQHQTSDSLSEAASTSNATNEGNALSVQTNVQPSAPDVVLIPNNNTVSCHKVFGLSFSNTGGGGGIGLPYRDQSCDFEQAGAAAAAEGNHDLAWFWRCHKKNLYKAFKDKGESKQQAIIQCHTKMVGAVGNLRTISNLKDRLATLRNERAIDHAKAKESKERITAACELSKDRILEACHK